MTEIDRRDFLKLSMGAAASLATTRIVPFGDIDPSMLLTPINDFAGNGPLSASFLLEWQRFRTMNPLTGLWNNIATWMPAGISGDHTQEAWQPTSLSLNELERWVTESCAVCNTTVVGDNTGAESDLGFSPITPVPAIMMSLDGLPNTYDLVGQAVDILQKNEPLDMSLNFFYDAQLEAAAAAGYYGIAPSAGVQSNLDVLAVPTEAIDGGADIVTAPPSVTLYGWRLQFRGPESHPLGSCVSQSVKHFHIELFRQNSSGGWNYITNLHIGTYWSSGRRCFVLWNNYRPVVCWKICSPTWDQLKQMLAWTIVAAAAIAGVVLATWVVATIASAAASALWVPLLLLA
jgi:hypothetical protein